jgi:hypothetical protein
MEYVKTATDLLIKLEELLRLGQANFDHDEIRDDLAETDTRLSFSTGECIAIVRRELGM